MNELRLKVDLLETTTDMQVHYRQRELTHYSMVWYGMVWYGMVWYGMVWYGIVEAGSPDLDSCNHEPLFLQASVSP